MTSLQSYINDPVAPFQVQDKWVKSVVWKSFIEEEQSEDILSFMENFDFPNLDDLKTSLIESGKYKKSEVEEIVAGLKTLPEYRD